MCDKVAGFRRSPVQIKEVEKYDFISQTAFRKSFCKSQFPHKSVNLFFIVTDMKNKLTDFCGNWLVQNDISKTFCEMCPLSLPHAELSSARGG